MFPLRTISMLKRYVYALLHSDTVTNMIRCSELFTLFNYVIYGYIYKWDTSLRL